DPREPERSRGTRQVAEWRSPDERAGRAVPAGRDCLGPAQPAGIRARGLHRPWRSGKETRWPHMTTMKYVGPAQKLIARNDNPVRYMLPLGEQKVLLNPLFGK